MDAVADTDADTDRSKSALYNCMHFATIINSLQNDLQPRVDRSSVKGCELCRIVGVNTACLLIDQTPNINNLLVLCLVYGIWNLF